jgi:hypothetical protein
MALREHSSPKCHAAAKGWELSSTYENLKSSLPAKSSSRWNKRDGKSLWLAWTKRAYFIKVCWKGKRASCENIRFRVIIRCSKRIRA